MSSKDLRKEFLKFFTEHNHTIVSSSSLIPADSSVLFTTAGMQQFKNYYLGEKSPYGSNVASCQKCFRTSDIEEIGDNTHLTFLEMLGNFSFGYAQDKSFGGYFKEKAIQLAFELVNSKFLGRGADSPEGCIPNSKITVTVFGGDVEIPRDEESAKIWKKFGFSEKKGNLHFAGREDNFWGPTGKEGPCGPTTEIHYDLTGKPCQKKEPCIPNCPCGRFIELWNLVFNEYFQDKNKKLTYLQQKGVDTGMGLERLAMICQEKVSVYETDLFEPIIQEIEKSISNKKSIGATYGNLKSERIIADHIKSAVFLISEGVLPSNIERGYVLRRILRRAIRYGKLLNLPENFLIPLAQKAIEIYQDVYPGVKLQETDILTVIQNEEEKFEGTLERGLKEFDKLISRNINISGEETFNLYQSYGFPLELTEELAKERGLEVDKKSFQEAVNKHREISRAGAERKFGGIGKEADLQAAKLHTATHLLHAALRQALGEHVRQMGSDITSQRLRFDFSHPLKMSDEEIQKIEDLVNQKIKENLEVKKEEMGYEKAIKSGALAFFQEKYPENVSVYSINNPSGLSGQVFSKEICAGPHVKRTSELGRFKIVKEESSGAGMRRIRAILE